MNRSGVVLYMHCGVPVPRYDGTSICLSCPLHPDTCDELTDPSQAKRLKQAPDCLITYAYHRGLTLAEAEQLYAVNRATGQPLDWYYSAVNNTALRKRIQAEFRAKISLEKS